jgi:hypothetical protein
MQENWKTWPTYPTYEVSDLGRVRNTKTGKILKQGIDRYGYPKLGLYALGRKIYTTVHRLVAQVWLLNPENKPQVNHINGVKIDNRSTNLEWNTNSENIAHSFELGLNDNRFAITLEDQLTGVSKVYRSFKSVGKLLGIYPSILLPLCKHSDRNPILGRYTVRVSSAELLKKPSNTARCGLNLYVYDSITGETEVYDSVLLAAYFTGIRCLGLVDLSDRTLEFLGYVLSQKEELLKDCSVTTLKEQTIKQRNDYWLKPYNPRPSGYILYDYYKQTEIEFGTYLEALDFLNSQEPKKVVITNLVFSSAVHKSRHDKNTGLVKGFGVAPVGNDVQWTNYKEEVIISSRYGCPAPMASYEITTNGQSRLIIGKHSVCRALGFKIDGSEPYSVLDRLLRTFNAPNVSVKRLNLPINQR